MKSMEKLRAQWPLLIGLLALFAALGVFAWASDAPAYAGHEAATCNNCHVMHDAYENWFHASHRPWAVCTDCHLPHENFIAYWYEKGRSGLHDVFVFSTGTYPERIRATERTRRIVQTNCVRCHVDAVESIVMGTPPFERYCWDCHRDVAHGQRGLSQSPYHAEEVYNR